MRVGLYPASTHQLPYWDSPERVGVRDERGRTMATVQRYGVARRQGRAAPRKDPQRDLLAQGGDHLYAGPDNPRRGAANVDHGGVDTVGAEKTPRSEMACGDAPQRADQVGHGSADQRQHQPRRPRGVQGQLARGGLLGPPAQHAPVEERHGCAPANGRDQRPPVGGLGCAERGRGGTHVPHCAPRAGGGTARPRGQYGTR